MRFVGACVSVRVIALCVHENIDLYTRLCMEIFGVATHVCGAMGLFVALCRCVCVCVCRCTVCVSALCVTALCWHEITIIEFVIVMIISIRVISVIIVLCVTTPCVYENIQVSHHFLKNTSRHIYWLSHLCVTALCV